MEAQRSSTTSASRTDALLRTPEPLLPAHPQVINRARDKKKRGGAVSKRKARHITATYSDPFLWIIYGYIYASRLQQIDPRSKLSKVNRESRVFGIGHALEDYSTKRVSSALYMAEVASGL